ncbi:MAG: excinuclease ABC subunit UvrC [Planctomycetes bacterium]|nr:excinuclease ABC subunit UvrC [Planctomycetota bacterium]
MPDDPDTPIADAPCEPGQEAPPPWGAESRDVRLARLHRTARALPPLPGVYLMKDHKGVVLYVGKAGRLCDRVSSYFVPSADLGPRKQPMLDLLHDFDTVVCEGEWEALLAESRLIKDIKPRFNAAQTDDKTFPYLAVTMRQDYPGVYITREPASSEFKGAKIFGPFTSPGALREAAQLLQRVFKFRTCHLDIVEGDPKNQRFRPCLLHAINQCTAPCAERITRAEYRADIDRFVRFVGSRRAAMLREMRHEMEHAAAELNFERAATLRDQIRALEKLDERSDRAAGWQPETEIGYINPASALRSLQKTLGLDEPIRCIEGIDIAHLRGGETVGSKVCFVDGRPFRNEYRRYRITSLQDRGAGGNDDYASIREVVSRRYRDAGQGDELYPDVILIDGGLGQLHAAQSAFEQLDVRPPMVISLAKKQELLYVQERTEPIRLGRENLGLRLCQQIRDEAHRFAQHYHHILRRKKTLGED